MTWLEIGQERVIDDAVRHLARRHARSSRTGRDDLGRAVRPVLASDIRYRQVANEVCLTLRGGVGQDTRSAAEPRSARSH
jgi:hypothetical protein